MGSKVEPQLKLLLILVRTEFRKKLYVSEADGEGGAAGVSTMQAAQYTPRSSYKDLFPFRVTHTHTHTPCITTICDMMRVSVNFLDFMNSSMQKKRGLWAKMCPFNKHFLPRWKWKSPFLKPLKQQCDILGKYGSSCQATRGDSRKLLAPRHDIVCDIKPLAKWQILIFTVFHADKQTRCYISIMEL